jgi:hypothetical protein
MSRFTRLTLALIYWAYIVPLRLVALVLRRDPLQLRAAPQRDSYWLELPPVDGVQHYFSQRSATEDRPRKHKPRGVARWLVPLFVRLARRYAPHRDAAPTESARRRPADQAIPDETYTLW